MLLGVSFAITGCAADSSEEDASVSDAASEEELKATPGQYEVDSLIKDLTAGNFTGTTINSFVDPTVGVHLVYRNAGIYDQLTHTTEVKLDNEWGSALSNLTTVQMTKDYRRVIPSFSCEDDNGNIFRATVTDPKTGKDVKITTGLKMFIHRWQPGGVAEMNPVSSTLEQQVEYDLIPDDAASKKAIADAKALEKTISVKVVIPALIFNKKDANGNMVPSNPGGAKDSPLDLYFGRVNGVWKLLVVDSAAYDCSA